MKQLLLLILSFSSLVSFSQSKEDSLLLLAKLYGVAEFVEGNREVSQEILQQSLAYYHKGENADFNGIVDRLYPKEPKEKYKILDTANLRVVNDPTYLLTTDLLSVSSKEKLRYAILAKRKSLKMVKKEIDIIAYEDVLQKELTTELTIETLFRIWNGIEYHYPFNDQLLCDWDQVLLDYFPVFSSKKLKDPYTYELEVKKLCAEVNDGHMDYIKHYTKKEYRKSGRLHKRHERKEAKEEVEKVTVVDDYFPTTVKMISGELYISNVAKLNELKDLKIGDKVLKINGKSADYYKDSVFKKESISRVELLPFQLNKRNAWMYFDGSKELLLQLENKAEAVRVQRVQMTNKEFDHVMGYDKIEQSRDASSSYAYLSIAERDKKSFKRELKRSEKESIPLIIDLRAYPKKKFVAQIAKYFSSKPKDIADIYCPLKHYPGYYRNIEKVPFFFTSKTDLVLKSATVLPLHSNILFPMVKKVQQKVVVLIDESTISWGESMALILKNYPEDVTLIGRNTNGTNGNVGALLLPRKYEMIFTHYMISNNDGSTYQHRGIPPDIYVEEEIPSKDNPNPDPIMTTALNYLFNEKAVVK